MKIRYQADENLDQAIVYGVLRQEPSLDFQTAQEAGLLGAAVRQWLLRSQFVISVKRE
ncbi:MAG: hypothetical protein ACRD3O_13125 [Terriglobia bacterium]